MIDGYTYLKDIGRAEIRVQDKGKVLHLMIVYFSERGTTRNYRVTWKKEQGRFVRDPAFDRLSREKNNICQVITHELMYSSLMTNA